MKVTKKKIRLATTMKIALLEGGIFSRVSVSPPSENRSRKRTSWRCRNEATMAVLMIDVDCFKNVNDAHGHPGGDACGRTETGYEKEDFGGAVCHIKLAENDLQRAGKELIAAGMLEPQDYRLFGLPTTNG